MLRLLLNLLIYDFIIVLGCTNGEPCPQFSVCKMRSDNILSCQCRDGFVSQGQRCKPINCHLWYNCAEDATCYYDRMRVRSRCQCNSGFIGDGYTCFKSQCANNTECGINARCVPDSDNQYVTYCKCNPGYHGDGYKCKKDAFNCREQFDCHKNAKCILQSRLNRYMCRCNDGYIGDGYNCTVKNSCKYNRKICAHNAICVYNEYFKEEMCVCKNGYIGDGIRCYTLADCDGESALLFTQSKYLINMEPSAQRLSKPKVNYINGIALDISHNCRNNMIYLSDPTSRSIKKCFPNGRQCITIINDLPQPEGVAVDWISQLLFWTDSKLKVIGVSSLDGKMRKILINSRINNPKSLAVNVDEGYIFWADLDRINPRIEKANMDGSERVVFVCNNISRPEALTFHYRSNELCWIDSIEGSVECIHTDGYNRRVVYRNPNTKLFSLSAGLLHIYATDWTSKKILKISLFDNTSLEYIHPPKNGRIFGLTTATQKCPIELRNACAKNKGNCPDILMCIPNKGTHMGRVCLCPDNTKECVIST